MCNPELGDSAAKDINFEVKPVEGESSPLVKGDADVTLPTPRLAPGGDCNFIDALSFDIDIGFDVSWAWFEEDGTQLEQSSRVSL